MTEATTTQSNETAAPAEQVGETTALGGAAADASATEGENTSTDAVKPEGGADEGEGGESKPDGDGEGGEGEAPTGAPETYDVEALQAAMPEGMDFDQEAFAEIEPVLRELDMSQDAAAKMMGGYAEKVLPILQARATEQFETDGAEMRATMARDLQADPEVGGKHLEENRAYAAKAIAHFLPKPEEREGFQKFMDESGFGNDRFLMRIIAGAGRNLSEATTPVGGGSTSKSTAEKWYPRANS